jgi:hypothetical protein
VASEWDANGAFRHFGNSGNRGDWNPTLWALVVGIWGLFVGIKALRVYLERPVSEAELDREGERLDAQDARRLRFHIAAWVLGMLVLTPLWALIEWQDNGGFARWSDNGHRGDWEPWILYVGGIWAFVVVALALNAFLDRRAQSDRLEH